MWHESSTQIGSLTVRRPADARAPSPAALRSLVEQRLGAAEPAVPGAPPSAILVVRRLADPLPGRLTAHPHRIHGDPAWGRAARERLGRLYSEAARPAAGAVPAGAIAVRFRDRAELLACFARDLVSGEALSWWWRAMARTWPAGRPAEPGALLTQSARELPAICRYLLELRAAKPVLLTLSASQALDLLRRMLDVHQLDPGLAPPDERAVLRGAPPWTRWLPAQAGELPSPIHGALLGIGLGLAEDPSAPRSPAFVIAARQIWRAIAPREPVVEPVGTSPTGRSGQARQLSEAIGLPAPADRGSSPNAHSHDEPSASRDPSPWPGSAEQVRRRREIVLHASSNPEQAADLPQTSSAEARSPEPISASPPPLEPTAERIARAHRSPPSDPGMPPTEESGVGLAIGGDESPDPVIQGAAPWQPAVEEGFETRLGGALYLINALPELHGPERAGVWTLSSTVGAWGVLAAAARALLDGPSFDEAIDDDPLWAMAAQLEGRAPEPVGPAEPWLAQRLPVWRQRLAAALDRDRWDLAARRELFAVTGRIFVGRTHIDLVADMEQISLPVRLAGFDRDPGWVPELGRVVLFHFE